MPIYEYQCPKCGTFELMQRITEAPVRKCPTCKGKVERLVSRTSFVLKGSGWYATDYARSSSKSEAKEKKPDATNGGTDSGAAKSESGSSSSEGAKSSSPSSSSSETKSSGSSAAK